MWSDCLQNKKSKYLICGGGLRARSQMFSTISLLVVGWLVKKKMDFVISDQIRREKMLVLVMEILQRSRLRRRRRNNVMMALLQMEGERKKQIMSCLVQMLMPRELTVPRPRRVGRNNGWFTTLTTYSNKRFKQALRVSRETFACILKNIRYGLERQTLTEVPILPEESLAIALYRYGRGDYCFTLEQMTGWATSTIREICNEVAQLIIESLWEKDVKCQISKHRRRNETSRIISL